MRLGSTYTTKYTGQARLTEKQLRNRSPDLRTATLRRDQSLRRAPIPSILDSDSGRLVGPTDAVDSVYSPRLSPRVPRLQRRLLEPRTSCGSQSTSQHCAELVFLVSRANGSSPVRFFVAMPPPHHRGATLIPAIPSSPPPRARQANPHRTLASSGMTNVPHFFFSPTLVRKLEPPTWLHPGPLASSQASRAMRLRLMMPRLKSTTPTPGLDKQSTDHLISLPVRIDPWLIPLLALHKCFDDRELKFPVIT